MGSQGVLGAAPWSHPRCSPTLTPLHGCLPLCAPASSRSALGIIYVSWPAVGSILEPTVEIILLLYFSVHFYPRALCNNQILGLVLKTLVFFYESLDDDFWRQASISVFSGGHLHNFDTAHQQTNLEFTMLILERFFLIFSQYFYG